MGVKSGDMVTIMSMHTPETIFCILLGVTREYDAKTALLSHRDLSLFSKQIRMCAGVNKCKR